MIKKMISLALIVGGISLLAFGTWEIWQTKQAQSKTLKAAEEIVKVEASNTSEPTTAIFEDGVIGLLEIPAIQAKLPIVEGTDEDDLEKGVGHYQGSALPNQKDQIVLSGHRDTVFKELGKLKLEDDLVVNTTYGSFTYKIKKTKIVEADDQTVITSTKPNEELVLTTCYPFGYVGNAPQRYIIYAYRD